jgi:hypothetical protein
VAYAQKLNAGSASPQHSQQQQSSLQQQVQPPAQKELKEQQASDKEVEKSSDASWMPQSNRLFGDLFGGESAPVQFGVPTSPSKDTDGEFVMNYRSEFTERPLLNSRLKRYDTDPAPTTTPTATRPARPSWFSRRQVTPTRPTQLQQPPPPTPTAFSNSAPTDELLTLNISSSLFPYGPADPLSPHAYHDLLLNATNLLSRLQTAYAEKCAYIASIAPELDVQREEAEEAETRARHLKIQLEDVARKAEDQLRVNQELATRLAEEKLGRLEALDSARRATGMLAQAGLHACPEDAVLSIPAPSDIDGADSISPDDTTPRRPAVLLASKKRASAGSASDSGFESDADTSSIFSGATSSGASLAGAMFSPPMANTPHMTPRIPLRISPPTTGTSSHNTPTNISATPTDIYALRPARNNGGGSGGGTSPVTALPSSTAIPLSRPPLSRENSLTGSLFGGKRLGSEGAAWATVEKLRAENAACRRHVEEMRQALQGCIEFVEGGGDSGSTTVTALGPRR